MTPAPPRVIEARELESLLPPLPPPLPDSDLLIVDVGRSETYLRGHVPGAVHLDYNDLLLGQPPAPGLLPPPERLQQTLRTIGLSAEKRVIAYDDQGNGRASRLLWTLEAVGHTQSALLNGGLPAWSSEGHALETGANQPVPGDFTVEINSSVIADQDYVLAALENEHITLLDARSPEEYRGLKSPSLRNGRIPGAVNLNWLDTIDRNNNLRFKPAAVLNAMLAELGVEREREVITYCQTHHRSSHSFMMLRHLGFDKLRGYPGSWSQWGNDPELPIE